MKKLLIGIIAYTAFIGTIFAANYAVEEWGIVSVGFGLVAPAAVYFVGLAFTLRDVVHITLGRIAVISAILIGAVASYFVSPVFAVASAIAFLVSELTDFAVFTALKTKLILAVLVSGIIAIVVDSIIFLQIAFGNLDFLEGQIVGKTWVLLVTLPLFLLVRKLLTRNNE